MRLKKLMLVFLMISLCIVVFASYEIIGKAKTKAESLSSVENDNDIYEENKKIIIENNKDSISKKNIDCSELEKKIKEYISDQNDKLGLVYYDINSGCSIKINENKDFKAASTVKVPINMYMYDLINGGKLKLTDTVKYEESDYEDGAGELTQEDLQEPISLQKLSDYSLIYSDNIATKMLIKEIGYDEHYSFIESIVGHDIAHEGNDTTAMDSSKILERLYNNPEKNPYYEAMIKTLKNTAYHDRIDKYIPQEICAHKIGDYESYVNDEAVVYDENPYILVIFTNEIKNADEFIANLSKLIYDEHRKISR